jgi:signal transduction histidine kinase
VQIEQVSVNLLQNACEAMEQLPARDRRVAVHLSASADFVEVGIEDCGAGVPEEIVSKVFETYFTTKRSGMGMGLSIAKRIIEHHGGRLWYTPKPGQGAIFHFTLPLSAGGNSE